MYHFISGIQIALKYSGSEITEILYSTVVLWQGKFCIYYSSSETLEVIYDKLYYGGENLVSILYRGSEFPTIETETVALWRGHKVYTIAEQCTLRHRIYDGG